MPRISTGVGNRRHVVSLHLVAPYREAFKAAKLRDQLTKHLESNWELHEVTFRFKNPCYPADPVAFHLSIHVTVDGYAALALVGREAFRWLRARIRVKKATAARRPKSKRRRKTRL